MPCDLVQWTSEWIEAFNGAKTALVNTAVLVHPAPTASIVWTTDASHVALGAVVEQRVANEWQPLAFFSHKITGASTVHLGMDFSAMAVDQPNDPHS